MNKKVVQAQNGREASTLADNLKYLILRRHINESELARLTSVSQPVIHRLANGNTKNPNIDTLRPLARFFNISIDQLIGEKALPLFGDSKNERRLSPKWTEVPIISWEMALNWQNTTNELHKKKFLRLDGNFSDDTYILVIEDSTMEPVFSKGAYIIIEPSLSPIDRDYVVVLLKEQKKPIFRQIFFSGSEVFLKSPNPDFNTIQPIKNYKILGVAVQSQINLRKNTALY